MEKPVYPALLLVRSGADKFAAAQKLAIVEPNYFYTQHRWDQLQKAKEPCA
jgi:L-asparaginase / beta-aspartyl-peptidase